RHERAARELAVVCAVALAEQRDLVRVVRADGADRDALDVAVARIARLHLPGRLEAGSVRVLAAVEIDGDVSAERLDRARNARSAPLETQAIEQQGRR